ncbi:MAG: hypothetical protein QOF58_4507 [Pseudonocardiales bacterium]|nr:hypothetical protein [Pseudonocardiales bacterium]
MVATTARPGWQTRLGIPASRTPGEGRLVLAVLVDTLGVGMVVPLSFLYFTLSTNLSLAGVGSAISAAILLSLPMGFVAGSLVDRLGPKPLLVINNVVAAVGYLLYIFAESWWGVFGAMFIVMAADRMYWAAWPNFVKGMTGETEMDSWFAVTEAVKNGCFGIGAIIGGVVLAFDVRSGSAILILLNVLSSLIAAWLFMLIDVERPVVTRPVRRVGQWRHVLRQRWMVPLVLAQAALTFAWLLPVSILPVYAVDVLHLGAWLPSLLFGLNCVGVFLFQPVVTARLRKVRRTRAVLVSGLLAVAAIVVLAMAPPAAPGQIGTTAVLVVFASALVTAASMFYLPSSNALISAAADRDVEGRTVSLFQMAWAFSAGVGPALIGWLLDEKPVYLWLVLGSLTLAGALGFRWAERSLPPSSLRPVQKADCESE